MREIIFRQRLTDDTFHYWGFIDGHFSSPVLNHETVEDAIKHSQQYIGRKDKNGKGIYEWDIVRYVNTYSKKEHIADVRWFNEQSCFVAYRKGATSDYDFDGDWLAFDNLEVIGNIYENKDLLV